MKYEALDANEKIDISFNKFGLMKGKLNDYLLFLIITMGGVIFLIEMVQYAVYTIRLHRNRIDVKSNEMELLYNLCKNKKYPQLYRNSVVSVPMLISILQPVIYLPDKKYSSEQLENILLHELTHLNQHDVAIKWIASITACIH